ncbi:MAG TPA: crossover junction endodeoxyribonuclease RuvC [Candidatus Limnocylindria bacterium]|jgi:Holliday junction resolvasome RuvABC endonuclease subunit|nr:crossover junction endodeoxyribonuclease RuvC [Candidatus Limnocylindria bacterium]
MRYRLLAIDQGSHACAAAYFTEASDVKPSSTDLFRRDGLPWVERMQYIAEQLLIASRTRAWIPDIVAIEDVVLHRNVQAVKVMSKTVGYLHRVVHELYPRARYIDINPSSTKAAARASMHRAASKDDIAHAVQVMTGLTGLSEDECDAIAVGWAAFGKLNTEHFARLAEQQA